MSMHPGRHIPWFSLLLYAEYFPVMQLPIAHIHIFPTSNNSTAFNLNLAVLNIETSPLNLDCRKGQRHKIFDPGQNNLPGPHMNRLKWFRELFVFAKIFFYKDRNSRVSVVNESDNTQF